MSTCARRPRQPPQRLRPAAVALGRHCSAAHRAHFDLLSDSNLPARHVTNTRFSKGSKCARARTGRQCRVLGCWACAKGNRRPSPDARRASIPSAYMSMMSVGDGASRLPPAATTGLAMAAVPGARAPAASAASVASAVASEARRSGSGGRRRHPLHTAACMRAKSQAASRGRETVSKNLKKSKTFEIFDGNDIF